MGLGLTQIRGGQKKKDTLYKNMRLSVYKLRSNARSGIFFIAFLVFISPTLYLVSVLGQDEGYTVKYNPLPEGVPEGEAQGNS